MTEKIGTIKNPLTIIAVFAGIAEVSGTVVLPFVAIDNQLIFICFLIFFPSILVIIFFLTLNFNNKALYAPSDFSDEENYIKIFRYDINRQENIEVEIKPDDLVKLINDNINNIQLKIDQKFRFINLELQALHEKIETKESSSSDDDEVVDFDEDLFERERVDVSMSNMPKIHSLRKELVDMGYSAEIYKSPLEQEYNYGNIKDHKSIWLGKRVPRDKAQEIIEIAINHFPHLEYIDLSDLDSGVPDHVHDQIFIGGATSSAVERGLKKLTKADFNNMLEAKSLKEFHNTVKKFRV